MQGSLKSTQHRHKTNSNDGFRLACHLLLRCVITACHFRVTAAMQLWLFHQAALRSAAVGKAVRLLIDRDGENIELAKKKIRKKSVKSCLLDR